MVFAWLDRCIDLISIAEWADNSTFGPFGSVGSLLNVAICGFGIAATVFGWVADHSPVLVFACILVVLEVLFVRIAVRVRRGDFLEV